VAAERSRLSSDQLVCTDAGEYDLGAVGTSSRERLYFHPTARPREGCCIDPAKEELDSPRRVLGTYAKHLATEVTLERSKIGAIVSLPAEVEGDGEHRHAVLAAPAVREGQERRRVEPTTRQHGSTRCPIKRVRDCPLQHLTEAHRSVGRRARTCSTELVELHRAIVGCSHADIRRCALDRRRGEQQPRRERYYIERERTAANRLFEARCRVSVGRVKTEAVTWDHETAGVTSCR